MPPPREPAPPGARPSRQPTSIKAAQAVLDWQRMPRFAAESILCPPLPSECPCSASRPGDVRRCERGACGAPTGRRLRRWPPPPTTCWSEYSSGAVNALDADLADDAGARPGRRCRGRGCASARRSPPRLIEERADDGYGDTTIHYTLPPAIGTWQPVPPATDMLGAWIGSMDPLVVRRLAKVDGPDKLTSDDYATDYNEVKLLGSATSTVRSQAQTDTRAVLQRQCGHRRSATRSSATSRPTR